MQLVVNFVIIVDMNKTVKRYIISSLVTFVAGFALAVVPIIGDITLQSFTNGAIVGVIFVGIRTGTKAVLESFLVWYAQK